MTVLPAQKRRERGRRSVKGPGGGKNGDSYWEQNCHVVVSDTSRKHLQSTKRSWIPWKSPTRRLSLWQTTSWRQLFIGASPQSLLATMTHESMRAPCSAYNNQAGFSCALQEAFRNEGSLTRMQGSLQPETIRHADLAKAQNANRIPLHARSSDMKHLSPETVDQSGWTYERG